jgi:hypothetical protein
VELHEVTSLSSAAVTRLVRDKALSELLAEAMRQGWRIERERKHVKCLAPDGHTMVVVGYSARGNRGAGERARRAATRRVAGLKTDQRCSPSRVFAERSTADGAGRVEYRSLPLGADSAERASRHGVTHTARGRMDPQHGHGTVAHDLRTEASCVLSDLRLEPLGLARIGVEGDQRPAGDELAVGAARTLLGEDRTARHA